MTYTLRQGEDRNINIYYRDKNGVRLDLSGATVTFVLASSETPETALHTITPTTYIDDEGDSHPLDTTGVATATITDTMTEALDPGTYVADAKITDAYSNDTISKSYTIVIKARRT